MNLFVVSTKIIKNVIHGIYNLKDGLKKETVELTRYEALEVSSICGLFFRNYFLIEHLAKFLNFPEKSDEFIFLGLLYVNNAFLKRVDQNKMFNDFLTFIIQRKYQISRDEISFIKNVISVKRTFRFFDVKNGSLEYYSLRFNKPKWLIKMLSRQYGKSDGLRIIYEMSSMPSQYVSTYYLKSFVPSNDFKKMADDLYLYTKDTSIRKEDDFHDKKIYLTQVGYHEVMSKFEYNLGNLTCYLGEENTIAYDFLKKFADTDCELNFISATLERNYKMFDYLKGLKLSNTHFYEASENHLENIFNVKQDFILYSPRSSNFELFRRNPEYGVYFQIEELDFIINDLKSGIRNISKYLEVDGKLLYLVPTINLKETRYLIEEFIEENKEEFELIEEKVYLPNKEENSLLYYAIIRRIK